MIIWIKERKGLYTADGGWSVSHEPDPNIINAPAYVIRWRGQVQGKAHSLRQALIDAGIQFDTPENARLSARGPFLTREQADAAIAPLAHS